MVEYFVVRSVCSTFVVNIQKKTIEWIKQRN